MSRSRFVAVHIGNVTPGFGCGADPCTDSSSFNAWQHGATSSEMELDNTICTGTFDPSSGSTEHNIVAPSSTSIELSVPTSCNINISSSPQRTVAMMHASLPTLAPLDHELASGSRDTGTVWQHLDSFAGMVSGGLHDLRSRLQRVA